MAILGVKKAAKNLGVSREDINAMEDWDDEFDENITLKNGHWVPKGDTDTDMPDEDPPPYKTPAALAFYASVYEEVGSYLVRFIGNPDDSEALSKVQESNTKILEYNREQGLPKIDEELHGVIQFQTIAGMVKTLELYRSAFMKNPRDPAARENWNKGMDMLRALNEKEGYPSNWVPDPLTDEAAPVTAATPGVTPGAAPYAKPETAAGIDWPWPTGLTAAGKRIMAYRPHGRGNRCAVETEPGSPVFTIMSGSEVGLLQLQQYLAMPGIKKMADPKTRRKWTHEFRKDFKKLEWMAIAIYKIHDPFSKTRGFRAPESWCGAQWTWGPEDLTTSELTRVLGETSAEAVINKICAENERTPPANVKPEKILQKPTKQDIKRMAAAREPSIGGDTAVDDDDSPQSEPPKNAGKTDPALEAILKKMDKRLDGLEKEREKSRSPVRGRRSSSRQSHKERNNNQHNDLGERVQAMEKGQEAIKSLLLEVMQGMRALKA
jgi:hypothetical protein